MRDKIKLGDVCTVVSGTTPKTGNDEYWNGDILWVTPAEITDDTFILNDTVRKITEKAVKESSLKPFPKGTVLLSSRAPIGKVAIAGKEMYCNQGFKNLICNTSLFNEYLYWFLKSKYDFLNSLGRGATFKEVSKSIVENVEIPLRDIVEQKHISSIMNKCQSIISLRNEQLKYLDDLIKSRFVEMFGDPIKNDKNWETRKLDDVCPVNKYKGQVDSTNNQVWLLNLDKIESDTGKILNYVLEDESKIASSTIKFDTNCVLYSKLRPYLNKVVIPPRSGYATSEMIAMQTNIVDKYFLSSLLRMKSFVDFANGTSYGAKMPRASVDMIKNFDLIFPPKELQNSFAQFAQQVDKLRFSFQQSLDETQKLFDSLMQEYFG